MKKIIFIDKSFAIGGIQTSMINLANKLAEKYDVQMLIYYPEGPLKSRLHPKVKLLEPCWQLKMIGMSFGDVLKTKNMKYIAFRAFAKLSSAILNNSFCVQIAAKHQGWVGDYDLAISYHHEMGKHTVTSGFSTIVDRCVGSKCKIAWIHYDPSQLAYDPPYNEKRYAKMDKIVCVSESVMKAFNGRFSLLKDKTDYAYNYIESGIIIEKSLAVQTIPFPNGAYVCFSAARLTQEKGIERAIKALAKCFLDNRDVVWYIAGDGKCKKEIQQLITSLGLENQVYLIGNQTNPYPYIKNCDLYMNLSFHEAAPMTFFEANILETRIFSTKTLSAEELLGEDDFICDNTSEGISQKFTEILKHRPYGSKVRPNESKKGDVLDFIENSIVS